MSGEAFHRIQCDGGCNASEEGYRGQSEADLRRRLHRHHGWATDAAGDDFCPKCTPETLKKMTWDYFHSLTKSRSRRIRPLRRHMSFEVSRLDHVAREGDTESAFADVWMAENHPELNRSINGGLGILWDLIGFGTEREWPFGRTEGPCYPVTTRDARVAATVVQWLGTNCGMSFLALALKQAGYRMEKISPSVPRRGGAK